MIQLNLALDYQALEARADFLVALCLGFKARLDAQSMKGLWLICVKITKFISAEANSNAESVNQSDYLLGFQLTISLIRLFFIYDICGLRSALCHRSIPPFRCNDSHAQFTGKPCW